MKVNYSILTLLIAALLFAIPASAQMNVKQFDAKYSKKPYHFGITMGYNISDFRVSTSDKFLASDSVLAVESVTGPGFNLGIITNLRLGNQFDLRFIPSLVFAEKKLQYELFQDGTDSRTIESIFVSFPILLKYKSEPHRDFRMYVIAGGKYTYDLGSNAKARNAEDQVKIGRHDFNIEAGIGMEFYFPYFIFSPEIKFSHGLFDVHSIDQNLQLSNVLGRLLTRAVTFSIHFEG
ncbi:MAG: hypothetical protein ACI959_000633 [Limisphaerales bacterium]|jgi:hypothetical protein